MAQETIYIETDEEITSIVDRLHKVGASYVVLVIPRGALALQSLVNLKLLKRESANAKKTIAVVTQDAIGKKLLAQAGIDALPVDQHKPVLEEKITDAADLSDKTDPDVKIHHFQEAPQSASETIESPIESPSEDKEIIRKRPSRKPIAIFVVILILTAVGAAAFLPSAAVKLTAAGESFERELDLEISTKIKVPSLEANQIPGEFNEEITTQTGSFNVTGKKDVGEKAKGTAAISNDSGLDQVLPKDTKLTGGALTFVTTADATVPKATLNAAGDKIPGKASVQVEATQAGEKFNVSNLAAAVPKDKLSGKIESAAGGATKEISIVTAEDTASATETLKKKAQDELKNSLAKKSGKIVMDGAVLIEAVEAKPSAAEGTETDKFDLTIKAKGKAIAFSEAVFRETFTTILRSGLPPDKDLVLSPSDEITTQVVDSDFTSGKLTVKGAIKTQMFKKINTNLIASQLVGKNPASAPELVKDLSGIDKVEITLFPQWSPRLPLIGARIKVIVEHQ